MLLFIILFVININKTSHIIQASSLRRLDRFQRLGNIIIFARQISGFISHIVRIKGRYPTDAFYARLSAWSFQLPNIKLAKGETMQQAFSPYSRSEECYTSLVGSYFFYARDRECHNPESKPKGPIMS
jgi:hypothetical protein